MLLRGPIRPQTVLLVVIAATTVSVVTAPHASAAPARIAPSTTIDIGEKECTLGFVFTDSRGKAKALTARHCGDTGAVVRTRAGAPVGIVERTSPAPADIAQISVRANDPVYSDIAGIGDVAGIIGMESLRQFRPLICKKGTTTGLTCGPIAVVADDYFSFVADADHGDSGGPVYVQTSTGELLAAGILEGSDRKHPDRVIATAVAPFVEEWGLILAQPAPPSSTRRSSTANAPTTSTRRTTSGR
jgi:hypothetical protein